MWWGLHVYVDSLINDGKTCSMVHDAYRLVKSRPSFTIVTNLQLSGFPEHTKILPLRSLSDILEAPKNTLVLIDDLDSFFFSCVFFDSENLSLFFEIVQHRLSHMMIFAASSRWCSLDSRLRAVTSSLRVCNSFSLLFAQMCTVRVYDTRYEILPYLPLHLMAYIPTKKVLSRYGFGSPFYDDFWM